MKVITFSRYFPKGHPKEGQPTHFVEKMIRAYYMRSNAATISTDLLDDFYLNKLKDIEPVAEFEPKWHTIRAGNRWKVGDLYAPRVWSGKPYASKQISFLPPVKIEKIWDIIIEPDGYSEGLDVLINNEVLVDAADVNRLALNDGLQMSDFFDWFNLHQKKKNQVFEGQILCWNPNINY